MAIKAEIKQDLAKNGRSTTTSIANRIGYSTGYVRQNAKELMADGMIDGEKAKRIPAYIINGEFVVITGDRQQLLTIVQKHAPKKYSQAKGMKTDALQEFIRKHIADQVVGGPWIWEFWV